MVICTATHLDQRHERYVRVVYIVLLYASTTVSYNLKYPSNTPKYFKLTIFNYSPGTITIKNPTIFGCNGYKCGYAKWGYFIVG